MWPFAEQRREQIRAHWGKSVKKYPPLWNGKLMLSRSLKVSGDCLSGQAFEIDCASYIAWRDWGCPDKTHLNVFGSALRKLGEETGLDIKGARQGEDLAAWCGQMIFSSADV